MKKLVIFLITILLAISIFGGCAKKETVPVEKATTPVEESAPQENTAPEGQ